MRFLSDNGLFRDLVVIALGISPRGKIGLGASGEEDVAASTHREIHHGERGKELDDRLADIVAEKEARLEDAS